MLRWPAARTCRPRVEGKARARARQKGHLDLCLHHSGRIRREACRRWAGVQLGCSEAERAHQGPGGPSQSKQGLATFVAMGKAWPCEAAPVSHPGQARDAILGGDRVLQGGGRAPAPVVTLAGVVTEAEGMGEAAGSAGCSLWPASARG